MNNVNFFKQSLLITAPTAIQGTDIADIFYLGYLHVLQIFAFFFFFFYYYIQK